MSSFQIRHATYDDMDSVVAIHLRCFPDYFLSKLGSRFLKRYYQSFLDTCRDNSDPFNQFFVGISGDLLIQGYVCGTTDMNITLSKFYRINLLQLLFIVLRQIIYCPNLGIDVLYRVINFLKSKLASHVKLPIAVVMPSATLCAIAVDQVSRGSNMAAMLVQRFGDGMKSAGIKTLYLYVKAENARAKAFYKKINWECVLPNSALQCWIKSL